MVTFTVVVEVCHDSIETGCTTALIAGDYHLLMAL